MSSFYLWKVVDSLRLEFLLFYCHNLRCVVLDECLPAQKAG